MVGTFFKRIFGDPHTRVITQLQKTVQGINALEPQYQALSDAELRQQTDQLRSRLAQGETLDEILPEAFAAVREASRRTIGLRHYDVQLIGGMILHQGEVTEMRTGEGKTLVATLPLYLNALTGQGAHLVTPNDYLAKFGVQWMGPIYHALGVSVSVIQSSGGHPDDASFLYDPLYASSDDRFQHLRPITRREAYHAEITYGTNNEFGFDYLRDNMAIDLNQCSQRELHYAIIDEVDSILIDEARTPLIISGPAEESSDLYQRFAGIVPRLRREQDYEVDERSQIAMLTDEGIAKIERILSIPEDESIYDPQHAGMLPYLDNALRAKEFFHRDQQYVIRNNEVIIIDEFTGRMMFGRRYSEGLHQAIEAKEGVKVQRESLTHATITFQNFFRMYDKLAGMTGTAETEKEELRKIYDLDVVVLPTNVEYRAQFGNLEEKEVPPEAAGVAFAGVINEELAQYGMGKYEVTVFDSPDQSERYYRRLDLPDQIYQSEDAKFRAVTREIAQAHRDQRPVLVGTTAIETSERLSKRLNAQGVEHNVLNAKYHEREAIIIAQAGRPAAVTLATNMAGRGVDILLGGNPEGLARDTLRKEDIDLTTIPSHDWESALKMARRGEDPTTTYPDRWTEVLYERVRQCQRDRERVYDLGGLHVIGTERHEARRIDNQLRGRAGRQGDPGSSRFYISLEDELMRRFGGERIQPWIERAGLNDMPLESKALGRLIENVQEMVEGYNFDIRKHVLEYDNVVNQQREVVYAERHKILSRDDLKEDMMEMVAAEVGRLVQAHMQGYEDEWTLDELLSQLRRYVPVPSQYTPEKLGDSTREEIVEKCTRWAERQYDHTHEQLSAGMYQKLRQEEVTLKVMAKGRDPMLRHIARRVDEELGHETIARWYEEPIRRIPSEIESQVEAIIKDAVRLFHDRRLMLRQLDDHWVKHLTSLDMLREGIGLRAYGKQDPLVSYQKEAFEMYQGMLASVQEQIVQSLLAMQQDVVERIQQARQRRNLVARRDARPLAQKQKPAQPQKPQTFERKPKDELPGRNDPCWCGSGKKYKHCHWKEDRMTGRTQ